MEALEIKEQVKLPNSTTVLVLGILSIPLCCCYSGIVSLIVSIVALVLYNKAATRYHEDSSAYTSKSFSNLKAGRICALIGLIISCLTLLAMVWWVANFGWESLNDPEEMRRILEDMQ